MKEKIRCAWVPTDKADYIAYHDKEWGRAIHDDRKLFEMLILEGAQAGLSWYTILKRRDGYRKAFKNFDPKKIAKMSDKELKKLLKNENIIKNKLKIYSTQKNAQVFLSIQKEFGSFDKYVWGFVKGKTKVHHPKNLREIPKSINESDALSKDLKIRGMSFVGGSIIYAYMQAVGLVNDHMISCFKSRHP